MHLNYIFKILFKHDIIKIFNFHNVYCLPYNWWNYFIAVFKDFARKIFLIVSVFNRFFDLVLIILSKHSLQIPIWAVKFRKMNIIKLLINFDFFHGLKLFEYLLQPISKILKS